MRIKLSLSLETAAIIYALLELEVADNKDNFAYHQKITQTKAEYIAAFDNALSELALQGRDYLLSMMTPKGRC